MVDITAVVSFAASFFIIFGGVLPYIPQYLEIKKTRNASGFSTFVSLILLIANILRLFFWFGKRFELPLVWQSIIMIITQLVMLEICVSLRPEEVGRRHHFTDYDWKFFWQWSFFQDYLMFIAAFSTAFALVCVLFLPYSWFVECLGFVSVGLEASLAVPQWYNNFKNKSTAGMSNFMVLGWFFGDVFKTLYFMYGTTPIQFIVCGTLQVLVDVAIILQIFMY